MFGGDLLEATAWPEALDGDVLEIEGQQISLLELAQADVAPTSIGHVPSLDAIIAGDAVYNRVHPMLALTGPEEWEAWIESIDEVEALRPRTVVAGHKRRDARDDDIPAMIDGTRGYIRDFRAALAVSSDPVELFETMKAKYEEYGNPTTLFVSAGAAFNRS
jgi:glyoxylase-like metal-dependent hydrolase (beta-lactamase superfamily II)